MSFDSRHDEVGLITTVASAGFWFNIRIITRTLSIIILYRHLIDMFVVIVRTIDNLVSFAMIELTKMEDGWIKKESP